MSGERNWSVYMIRAGSGALYTGITTDVRRRWQQHRSGGGARFFSLGGGPAELVFLEPGHTRSSASRREADLKRLNRQQKLRMLAIDGLGKVCWIDWPELELV